jgi:hypothetical protein
MLNAVRWIDACLQHPRLWMASYRLYKRRAIVGRLAPITTIKVAVVSSVKNQSIA